MAAEPEITAKSPCIGACRLDPGARHCLGCGRTLREITHWREMSDEQRRRVNARLRRAAEPRVAGNRA